MERDICKKNLKKILLFLASNFGLLEGNRFHSREQIDIVWRWDTCKMFQIARFAGTPCW